MPEYVFEKIQLKRHIVQAIMYAINFAAVYMMFVLTDLSHAIELYLQSRQR